MKTVSSKSRDKSHKSNTNPPAALTQPVGVSRDTARSARLARSSEPGRVSPTLARLEPWVSWSLAAYTAWVALFSFADVPVLWLFVLYAGVLGKWCDLYPSRHQGRMFSHGALLICGAYFLHTHTSGRIGGAGGLFFFWVAIPALAYAFMLRPRWAVGIVALAACEFIASNAVTGTLSIAAFSQGGYLLLFPLVLALPFGEAMRKPDQLLEQTRIDTSTGLLNRDGLVNHGDELLQQCRREKRPVTVAVFGCEDLLALRDMYGRKIGRKALDLLVGKFEVIAASRGLVARTGAAEFSLVLPGLSRDKAIQAIARQLGNPLRLEFDMSGEEVVMTPVVVLEEARANESSIEALHTELHTDLQQLMATARQEGATPQGDGLAADTVQARADAVNALLDPVADCSPVSILPTMPAALGAG